jgi:hypothetical protein
LILVKPLPAARQRPRASDCASLPQKFNIFLNNAVAAPRTGVNHAGRVNFAEME